jgi:hypothetical protein
MSPGTFGPRFVPSTAARRFVLDDERTEVMPDRLIRDRADTVRILPPSQQRHLIQFFMAMPAMMKLILAGIVLGSIFAVVYAYRPLIG